MKNFLSLFLLIAITIAGHAQTRKTPGGLANASSIKITALKIDPRIIASRKVTVGSSSFTNPSFTRPLTSDNINVTYKLKPVSISDNNGSNAETSPTNQPSKPGYTCTYTREKVTVNSTDFLSVSYTGEGIYPGAIYRYDDFYKGNFQSDVRTWQRNPIIISSDASRSVTVANPSQQLSDAAVSLKNSSPLDPGAIAVSQYTYSSNSTVMQLNATAGGAYAGFSGSAGFNFSKADSSIYITYDFRKILFTLSAAMPSNGFFTDATKEKTPNLIWLGSVSYGARVMANVKINASQLKIGANAQFQYGDPKKAGFQAAADFKDNNQNTTCTVNIYSVGLPSSSSLVSTVTTTLADLDRQILNALNAVTAQSAKPVMYSLYNMAGERIAVESATDYYVNPLCIKNNATYYLTGVKVTLGTGNDNKDGGAKLSLLVYPVSGGAYWGNFFKTEDYTGEMKKGTATSFNLGKAAGFKNFTLDQYKQSGVEVDVIYNSQGGPFPLTDAWMLENVVVELEFRDQDGNLAPPIPAIKWENINTLMTTKKKVYCKTDGYWKPMAPKTGTY
ncbi:MAG TPA: hypothetical protein VHM26_06005 [Chitinophagaceae bacterium]|jgi:hypothetical protein|nr:hypothetical protein [Chitinophagaceae bacterium]